MIGVQLDFPPAALPIFVVALRLTVKRDMAGKKRGGGALCCIGFPTSERITDRIQRERGLMDKAIVSPEFGVNPRRV